MNAPPDAEPPSRTELIRDVVVFQVKLWVEGVKDVVLIPLSLGAVLVDVLFRRRRERCALYAVMRLGDRFERWVNLYGPLDDAASGGPKEPGPTPATDARGDQGVP
jgi:hypothetical protein